MDFQCLAKIVARNSVSDEESEELQGGDGAAGSQWVRSPCATWMMVQFKLEIWAAYWDWLHFILEREHIELSMSLLGSAVVISASGGLGQHSLGQEEPQHPPQYGTLSAALLILLESFLRAAIYSKLW